MTTNNTQTKENQKETAMNVLQNITVSFAPQHAHKDEAFPMSFLDVLIALKGRKFDAQIEAYNQAKSNSTDKVNKDAHLSGFLPHCEIDGSRKLKLNGVWDHNAWKMSGLFHFDLDDVSPEDYHDVKSKLLSLNPIALFKSPNGGVKCFFKHNLDDSIANREIFQRLVQCQSKMMLLEIDLGKYYDQSPTTPTSKCYMSGGEGFDIVINSKFDTIDFFLADMSIRDLALRENDLNTQIKAIEAKARTVGDMAAWNDLDQKHRERLTQFADDNLSKAIASSTNKGNKTSFVFGNALFNLGMDFSTVSDYVAKLQRALPNAIFDINTQVLASMNTTGKPNCGGKLVKGSNFEKPLAALKEELVTNHNLLKGLAYNIDNDGLNHVKATNKVVELTDFSDKTNEQSIDILVGLPGSGKTFTILDESVGSILNGGFVTYACHNLNAIEDRINELCSKLTKVCLLRGIAPEPYLANIKRVSSGNDLLNHNGTSDTVSEQPDHMDVRRKFEKAHTELKYSSQGGIVFCTDKGLHNINVSTVDKNNSTLYVDDSCDSPELYKMKLAKELWATVESFIVSTKHNSSLQVKSLSVEGKLYLSGTVKDCSTSAVINLLESIEKLTESNVDIYLIAKPDENMHVNLHVIKILSSNTLNNFGRVCFVGDSVEKNIYLLALQSSGVKLNMIKVPHRYNAERVENLCKISALTEHQFSKLRVESTPQISVELANVINSKYSNDKVLIPMNNIEKDVFQGVANNLDDSINYLATTPITKGLNSLTDYNTIINFFSTDPSPMTKMLYKEVFNIDADDLTNFIYLNQLVQNMFRGNLRLPDNNDVANIVCPDEKTARWLIDYVNKEMDINLQFQGVINTTLSDLFIAAKAGRKSSKSDGVAMTSSERKKISKLRTTYTGQFDINALVEHHTLEGLFNAIEGTQRKSRIAALEQLTDQMNHDVKYFDNLTVKIPVSSNTPQTTDTVLEMAQDAKPTFEAIINEIVINDKVIIENTPQNDDNYFADLNTEIIPKSNVVNIATANLNSALLTIHTMDTSSLNFG